MAEPPALPDVATTHSMRMPPATPTTTPPDTPTACGRSTGSSPRVPLIPVLRSSPHSASLSPRAPQLPSESGRLTARVPDDVSMHSDPSPRAPPAVLGSPGVRPRGASLSVEIPRRADGGEHVRQTSSERTPRGFKSPTSSARKVKLAMERPKRAFSRGLTTLFKRHSLENTAAGVRDTDAHSDGSDERGVRFLVSGSQQSSRVSSETDETPPLSPLPAAPTHAWALHEGTLHSVELTSTLTVTDVLDALGLDAAEHAVRDAHATVLSPDTVVATLTPPICVVCIPESTLGRMWVAPTSPPTLFYRDLRERTDEELDALVEFVKDHAAQQKRGHALQRRQSKKNAIPERREVQRQADHKGLYLNIAKTWVNRPGHKLRIVTGADGFTRMQAGHVPALVELLVHPTGVDRDYQLNFLMTYNALCTPDELLAHLQRHFAQPRDPAATTRAHVLDFLKLWLTQRAWDFASDSKLEQALVAWLRALPAGEADPLVVRSLLLLAEAQLRGTRKEYQRTMEATLASEDVAAAPPLYARVLTPPVPDVLDWAPGEVARQMCVRDARGMKAIDVKEWMRAAWGRTHAHAAAPNLDAFVEQFNVRSRWVATTVVCGRSIATRVAALRFWLSVASECLLLRNFHAALSVVAGLTNAAVERLAQTLHALPMSAQKSLASLRASVSVEHNFRMLRELEAQAAASGQAAVPYVGMAMGDLTAMEDGNADTTHDGLVNWEKHEMVARVVLAFEAFKARRYVLRAEPALLALFEHAHVLSDDELFERSLETETREANAALRARLGT